MRLRGKEYESGILVRNSQKHAMNFESNLVVVHGSVTASSPQEAWPPRLV